MSGDIEKVIKERGARYGSFWDHAEITYALKNIIYAKKPREAFPVDQRESLDMICHKLGRIVCGDHNYADSWVDIAGYSKLISDRLLGEEK